MYIKRKTFENLIMPFIRILFTNTHTHTTYIRSEVVKCSLKQILSILLLIYLRYDYSTTNFRKIMELNNFVNNEIPTV